jgi:hypothetical protein
LQRICSWFDSTQELNMTDLFRLQLGKKRKNLEEAFEERTAELRTLSECMPTPDMARFS